MLIKKKETLKSAQTIIRLKREPYVVRKLNGSIVSERGLGKHFGSI